MDISGYEWKVSGETFAHSYLMGVLISELDRFVAGTASKINLRAFDLGCGNGSVAKNLCSYGWKIVGVDPSLEGINLAKANYPGCDLHLGSAYDDLATRFGKFPVVYSLEVVEHVYAPREYARCVSALLEDDGVAIVSTPYHGYWKNLVMALTGKMDSHFTALWDHGHIKFWSVKTLTQLFEEVGLEVIRVHRVGRIPVLAKSMVLVLKRKR